MFERIERYQRDLAAGQYPASYVHDSLDIRGAISEAGIDGLREDAPPEAGADIHTLLDEMFELAMPNGTVHPHPGFLAHVPSGGLYQGVLGELLARALNRFIGVWIASPGFSQLESNVIRWFCSMLGYGPGSFGYLTTGGSIANFMGLRCALERLPERHRHRATVYVSEQGHFSVLKAARLAGIPTDQVRRIGTDLGYCIDIARLAERIVADARRGLIPTCVVATAGTTNTGAIDDLSEAARVSREHGLWLHADACLGGFFRITARGRVALAGIERADSIAVDAHKSLFLPHGSSALLVRRQEELRAAFEVPGGAYLPGMTGSIDHVDFCDYGPELSREVRALTAWLPLKLHGVAAFAACLDHKLDLADNLAGRLAAMDGIEVVPRRRPHLPVVAFRPRSGHPARRDELTRRLCALTCAPGNVYLTTTTLPEEGLVVRACPLHHQTDEATMDRLVADLGAALRALDSQGALS